LFLFLDEIAVFSLAIQLYNCIIADVLAKGNRYRTKGEKLCVTF